MEMDGDNLTRQLELAIAYAENIIATLREPFVVLDSSLRVRTANAAFYRGFHSSKARDGGPVRLRPGQRPVGHSRDCGRCFPKYNSHPVEDFEVEHAFPAIGRRNMLLNVRRFPPESDDPHLVLLAIEDITHRRRAEAAV